jgi:hypothetical protein
LYCLLQYLATSTPNGHRILYVHVQLLLEKSTKSSIVVY